MNTIYHTIVRALAMYSWLFLVFVGSKFVEFGGMDNFLLTALLSISTILFETLSLKTGYRLVETINNEQN